MNDPDQKPDDKTSSAAAESSRKSEVDQRIGPASPQDAGSFDARRESTGISPGRYGVKIEYKHSLAIRWMHWINFPLLALMIYSGLLIYWADSQHEGLNAHRVYRVGLGSWTLFRLFPPWFYNNFDLKFQLARGLGYHFFFHVVLRPERSSLCPVHVIVGRVAGLGSEPEFIHRSNRSDIARFGIEEESSTPVQVQRRTTVGLYRCNFHGRGLVAHRQS